MNEQETIAVKKILQAAGKYVDERALRKHATVGNDGRVILLNLDWCDKLTTLPPEIGQLSKLEKLILSECYNLMSLPPEIGQLSQLNQLNLSFCGNLTALPPDIGQLSQLKELDLTFCNLTTLPPEIGQLSKLEKLSLPKCENLRTLPPNIGELSQLKKLNLTYCNLTTLPPEIGKLSRLEYLSIAGCKKLTTLPTEIGKLSQLKELDLGYCENLMTLPPEIEQLSQLKKLDLSECESLMKLPAEIGQLSQLKELNLRGCHMLTTLPAELGQLSQLEKLSLSNCKKVTLLPVMLPPEIGQSSHLKELDLSECENLMTLPAEIERLTKLEKLDLRGCHKLTTLPAEIGQLSQLEKLNLRDCQNLSVPPWSCLSSINEGEIISFMQDLFKFLDSPATSFDLLQDKPDLLLCAVQTPDPIYASAVAAAFKAHPTLRSLCDSNSRTALELACHECRQELLFYKRYDLEERCRYESPTCKVFFAVDCDSTNDSMDGRPVALKFMEHKDHLDAELKARKRDDGEDRFDKEYVIVALAHHNGGNDPEFLEATKKFNLPKYCLVLEQGERSLGDVILNENISRDLLRARLCLKELAEALEHIHECGYVHCDIKPKNAIREVAPPRKWKIIDFDSTTEKGKPMGNKVSTGYLPPELVSMKEGRPVLRCLCVFDDVKRISIAGVPAHASDDILRKDEVAVAHESIDAWSFGCVAYFLITGWPLIETLDVNDNLNKRGLRYLAKWNKETLGQALKKVYDPSARDLLQGLLNPEPGKRWSMTDTLKHDFFHPDEVAKKNEQPQQNKNNIDQEEKCVALPTYAEIQCDLGPFKKYAKMERRKADPRGALPDSGDPDAPTLAIVTTAEAERKAVLARLDEGMKRVTVAGSMIIFGKIGRFYAVVLETRMGTFETKDYLTKTLPHLPSVVAVAFVGFGWGSDPALKSEPDKKQRIGDVMFPSTCVDLSHNKRVDGGLEVRGDITSAVSNILDKINSTLIEAWQDEHKDEWPSTWCRPPTVHVGTFVSMPTLMNDREETQKVLKAVKDRKPIGGDMEVYQIIRAVQQLKPPKKWFAVKSICDFGGLIPKNKDGQALAAATAADFMHFIMNEKGLFDELLAPSTGDGQEPVAKREERLAERRRVQEEELLAERRHVQEEARLAKNRRVQEEEQIPELEENEEEFQC